MGLDRRPLKSRGTIWAKASAKLIAKLGVSPNQISILSVFMAMASMMAFYFSTDNYLLLSLGALFIQLRLACNLFDGMVAIEYNKKTKTGDIYNDAPDRLADVFIIMGAALALREMPYAMHFGWAAACLAVLTAYIRVLGSSLGTQGYFSGPMAKPHRMAMLTFVALAETATRAYAVDFSPMYWGLILIIVGSVVTCYRRMVFIVRDLEQKA